MIVIDNTVLSNFARTNQFQLLELFCRSRGLIVQAVREEFQQGISRGLFPETDLSWMNQIDITDPKEIYLSQRYRLELGNGESDCLAIAVCRNHELLTDDRRARQIGFREQIRVSGSVGVLGSLIRRSTISLLEGNQVLKEFIKAGYFSPVEELDDLI